MDTKVLASFLIVLIIFIIATLIFIYSDTTDICIQYDRRNSSKCVKSRTATTFDKVKDKAIIGLFVLFGAVGVAYLGHALVVGKSYADIATASNASSVASARSMTDTAQKNNAEYNSSVVSQFGLL